MADKIQAARWLISAIPNPFENGSLVEQCRDANPRLEIVARAHSDDEVRYLDQHGATFIIVGEEEIARGMVRHVEASMASSPRGPASIAAATPLSPDPA